MTTRDLFFALDDASEAAASGNFREARMIAEMSMGLADEAATGSAAYQGLVSMRDRMDTALEA